MDLSIILLVKDNWNYTYRTYRNLQLQLEGANKNVEILILLDKNHPEATKFMKKSFSEASNLVIVDFDDLETTREIVIKKSKAKQLLFIESGDYISGNFVKEFYSDKRERGKFFISEKKIFFGEEHYTEDNIPSSDTRFTKFSLLLQNKWGHNPWGTTFFISKDDFKKVKLQNIARENKIGTGINTFYCRGLELGMQVDIIPRTISFYKLSNQCPIFAARHILPKSELFNEKVSVSPMEKPIDDRFILKKIISEKYPDFYIKLFIAKERILSHLKRFCERNSKRNDKKTYPEWMYKEWREINNIEPVLFPPSQDLYNWDYFPNKKLDVYLSELLCEFPANIDFLVFCPWLKRGGADKLVINLLKGLKLLFPKKTVGLVLTEKTDSEIVDNIPKGIYYYDFGNRIEDITAAERMTLLLRFIIQIGAKRIININSHSLFNLLLDYSKQISFYSKLYCFCFSPSQTKEGQLTGFSFDFIPKIIDDLELVLTDNQNIIDVLHEMFGLDKSKFKVLYQPVELDNYRKNPAKRKHEWKILWASRIDYEKLPDVLERIIIKSKGRNWTFHIHGNSVLDDQFPLSHFNKHPNAFTYGPYKGGLSAIDYKGYDLFLYTSQFDGMPNTVLEAVSLGLPVIASNVGGIKEIIKYGETGYLIENIFDEDEYVEKIEEAFSDIHTLNRMRNKAFKQLEFQHSWEKYLDTLKRIFI